MVRFARQTLCGELVHVISRFTNHAFRLRNDEDRQQYLRRAANALTRTDCRPIAYALMSSHVHWVVVVGRQPLSRWLQPMNTAFARYANAQSGALGPVFAERFRALAFRDTAALALVAYVHNNPVRAGVVPLAADSDWTSHRAYLDATHAPPWLDTALGLVLCGFDDAQDFDSCVNATGKTRDAVFSGGALNHDRAQIRRELRLPIELGQSSVGNFNAVSHPLVYRKGALALAVSGVSPAQVIVLVCQYLRIEKIAAAGRSQAQEIVAARRLALLIWRKIGGVQALMTMTLGIAETTGSQLLRRNAKAVEALVPIAERLVTELLK